MKLFAADIHCVNAPCASHGQNFRKAPGRSADIEANTTLYVERKMIERSRKLHAAARHIRMFGFRHYVGRRGNLFGCFTYAHTIRGHKTGSNSGLSASAAFEQA